MINVLTGRGEETWTQRHRGEHHVTMKADTAVAHLYRGVPRISSIPDTRERHGNDCLLELPEAA